MRMFIFFSLLLQATLAGLIGIDLGSEYFKVTFTQVSLIRPGKKLVIVENPQSKRMTNNMISMTKSQRVFGDDAFNQYIKNPKSILTYMNNLLGVSANSTQILSRFEKEYIPTELSIDQERMTITMKVNDEEFSPELAMAMQFEFIKKLSITMGDGLVKDCSITVPSYWTIAQRLAVLNAADAAKLNVVTLVSENTAAGFYYAIDRLDEKDYHAIIYNLGSWNLEVSVLKYNTAVKHITKHTNKTIENVEVLAHSWDQSFGGRTIDTLIADDLMDGFKEKYGVDPRLKPKSVAKFMKQAGSIKKTLSASKFAIVILSNVQDGLDYSTEYTRERFESLLEKYADRMINPVYDAMQKANVTTADIDTFEIVGGLTRIPYVQQLIKDRIGLEPGAHLNGDEAMAHGAAIIAANYTSDVQVKAIWLSDAIPYDILVDFYNPEDPEFKKSTVAFKQNGRMPTKKRVSFNYHQDFKCKISANYSGEVMELFEYDVVGVAESVNEHGNVPNVILTFILDRFGYPHVVSADGTIEVQYVEKVKKVKEVVEEQKTEQTEEQQQEEKQTEEEQTEEEQTVEEQTEEEQQQEQQEEEQQEEEYEEVTKTKQVTKKYQLSYAQELQTPKQLRPEQIQELRTKLEKYTAADEERERTAEAKNDLESFIYYTKDHMDDETFNLITSDEQRESLQNQIVELQDWMDTREFVEADSATIKEKRKEIYTMVKDAEDREAEYKERIDYIPKAQQQLESLLEQYKNLVETMEWLKETDKNPVQEYLTETQQWMTEKLEEQSNIALWDPPAFKVGTLQTKLITAERKIFRMSKIAKPKEEEPPKEEEQKEETSEETNQETNEETVNQETNEEEITQSEEIGEIKGEQSNTEEELPYKEL